MASTKNKISIDVAKVALCPTANADVDDHPNQEVMNTGLPLLMIDELRVCEISIWIEIRI